MTSGPLTRVLRVDQDVEQRLVQQQRDRRERAAGLLPCCSTDLDAAAAQSVALRLASMRVTTRSICSRRRVIRCEPVKTSRFRTILAARSASRIDLAQLAAHGRGRLGGVDQQLEMPEHALQRVVHLVRDAGDELSERRELFRLGQPRAQRLALALEARLSRDVAGDERRARSSARPG